MKQRPTKPTPQGERFKAAAKELGCDQSEAAFEHKLKKLATVKVNLAPKKKTPAK